jgi:hypothetical protein
MAKFVKFRDKVEDQFNSMGRDLYKIGINVYDKYLESFPGDSNPVFRTNTEHDCSTCKGFIKNVGDVVAIDRDYNLVTVWDIKGLKYPYDVVAKELSAFVKSHFITEKFYTKESSFGEEHNYEVDINGEAITWHHFSCDVPGSCRSTEPASDRGEYRGAYAAFKRALTDYSVAQVDLVLELIAERGLYRGNEFAPVLKDFKRLLKRYNGKDAFIWKNAKELGATVRRNVIHTLLDDLADGKDFETAVISFEKKIAPENYKRPKALITKRMIEEASKKIEELGLQHTLQRRMARLEDVTVNDTLFVDRNTRNAMGGSIEQLLAKDVATPRVKNIDASEIDSATFIESVLPGAQNVEVYVDGMLENNFVNLIAPVHKDEPLLFKWDNNFSWTYNGNFADSVKARVKKAGGDVEGDLRISLSWFNLDDLDLHLIEPDGTEISFNNKLSYRTGGRLDVDMNVNPDRRDAVENITYSDRKKIPVGDYKVIVHNYTKRETIDVGFEIEVEADGDVKQFSYQKPVGNKRAVEVLKVHYDGELFSIKDVSPDVITSSITRTIYNIQTNAFHPVHFVCKSPNYWGDNATGNEHLFFMLKDCKTDDAIRGFFNEYLRQELVEYRKVFEVLADRMRCESENDQLAGVGFTYNSQVLVKVDGRPYTIKF